MGFAALTVRDDLETPEDPGAKWAISLSRETGLTDDSALDEVHSGKVTNFSCRPIPRERTVYLTKQDRESSVVKELTSALLSTKLSLSKDLRPHCSTSAIG
jgi:hypothetical protein